MTNRLTFHIVIVTCGNNVFVDKRLS